MADAAKALGIGPEIEFRGKKYRLTPWTLEMSCLFEDWLEQSAWDAVQRCRGRVADEVYHERLDRVATLIAAKAFAIGGEAAAIAARSTPGQKYSFYLQL